MSKLNRKQLVEALCGLYALEQSFFEGMNREAIRQWIGQSFSIVQQYKLYKYATQEVN